MIKLKLIFFFVFFQDVDVFQEIFCIFKAVLFVITPCQNMINIFLRGYSGSSWHGKYIPKQAPRVN